MKKQYVLIGIVAMLSVAVLSGCYDLFPNGSSDTNNFSHSVEISEVFVVTKWWIQGSGEQQESGFYQVPAHAQYPSYELEGIVTNIAQTAITEIQLNATFFDDSGAVITTRTTYIRALSPGDSTSFWLGVHENFEPRFDEITGYELEIMRVIFQEV